MADWTSELEKLGPVVLTLIVALSFAVYIAVQLGSGFGPGAANNIINTIITGLQQELTTFWPILLIAVFIGATYIVLRWSGVIGGGHHSGRNR